MGFTGNRAEGPLIEEVNTVPEKLGESPVGPSQTFSLWLVSGLEQDLEISTEALLPLLAWVGSSTQYSQLKAKTPPSSTLFSSHLYCYHELVQAAKEGGCLDSASEYYQGMCPGPGSGGRFSRAVCDQLVTPLLLSV